MLEILTALNNFMSLKKKFNIFYLFQYISYIY